MELVFQLHFNSLLNVSFFFLFFSYCCYYTIKCQYLFFIYVYIAISIYFYPLIQSTHWGALCEDIQKLCDGQKQCLICYINVCVACVKKFAWSLRVNDWFINAVHHYHWPYLGVFEYLRSLLKGHKVVEQCFISKYSNCLTLTGLEKKF